MRRITSAAALRSVGVSWPATSGGVRRARVTRRIGVRTGTVSRNVVRVTAFVVREVYQRSSDVSHDRFRRHRVGCRSETILGRFT
jgi:hypothetical protein